MSYRKLDFDLLRQRKVLFQGREYPIREKTVRDEIGAVRKFKDNFAALISDSTGKSAYERRCRETKIMSDTIRHFCDIDEDVLFGLPIVAFNSLYFCVLGGGESDVFDADEKRDAGEFRLDGKVYIVSAPSVRGTLDILKMTESTGESDTEILVSIAAMCVPGIEREELYGMPYRALSDIVDVILGSIQGDDLKNVPARAEMTV